LALLGPLEVALRNDTGAAVAYLREADAIARRGADDWTTFYVLTIHANVRALNGEARAGMALMQEALDIAREFGNSLLIAHASVELGLIALLEGEMALAKARLAEGAALLKDLHHREGLSYLLDARGIEAVIEGDLEKAATAFGAAEGLRAAIRLEMWPPIRGMRQAYVQRLESELDETTRARQTAAGRAMTTDQAIGFCFGASPGP
jgi:hypothetical protein